MYTFIRLRPHNISTLLHTHHYIVIHPRTHPHTYHTHTPTHIHTPTHTTHTHPTPTHIHTHTHSSGSDVRQLIGHNGPVFSTSFNPDNSFLISGSEDGTGKLLPYLRFQMRRSSIVNFEFSYIHNRKKLQFAIVNAINACTVSFAID